MGAQGKNTFPDARCVAQWVACDGKPLEMGVALKHLGQLAKASNKVVTCVEMDKGFEIGNVGEIVQTVARHIENA